MDCQMSIIIKGNINMTKSNHQPLAVPSTLGDAFLMKLNTVISVFYVCNE
mgnify:CR=1 FL=1